jgi:hypothetical protein
MTAVAVSRPAGLRPARLLRLEIKHSPFLWALPVLAALFYYDTYRTSAGLPPIWTIRSTVVTNHMLYDFSVFAAGLAAWAGSREGRRKTGDLLATTVRAAWARRATVLAGTAFWTLLAFLAGVALVYVQTALQATWGGPPLWPVAVGVLGVAAACAIGFTCGTFFPGRFTAPLVAVAVLVLDYVGHGAADTVGSANGTYGVLSPAQPTTGPDVGVFYHVAPDVAIAQVMFIGGVIVVMAGLLALSPVGTAGRRFSLGATGKRAAAAAVVLVACGAAAAATAFSLAGTAQYTGATGWAIPALHDAASDQPVPYTPECATSGFPVCIHPAFARYLHAVTAALQPAAAEIAGLPGAPVRAEQVPGGVLPGTAGTTSVYEYPQPGGLASFWAPLAAVNTTDGQEAFQQDFLTWFVAGPVPRNGPADATPAQQVVVTALMAEAGSGAPLFGQEYGDNGKPVGPSPAQIGAAVTRFESLSKAAQHAWLATHMAQIRAGGVTLAQIP